MNINSERSNNFPFSSETKSSKLMIKRENKSRKFIKSLKINSFLLASFLNA